VTDFARRVLRFCGYAHTSTRFFRAVAIGFALVAIAYEVCIAFNLGGAWFATAVATLATKRPTRAMCSYEMYCGSSVTW